MWVGGVGCSIRVSGVRIRRLLTPKIVSIHNTSCRILASGITIDSRKTTVSYGWRNIESAGGRSWAIRFLT